MPCSKPCALMCSPPFPQMDSVWSRMAWSHFQTSNRRPGHNRLGQVGCCQYLLDFENWTIRLEKTEEMLKNTATSTCASAPLFSRPGLFGASHFISHFWTDLLDAIRQLHISCIGSTLSDLFKALASYDKTHFRPTARRCRQNA